MGEYIMRLFWVDMDSYAKSKRDHFKIHIL